MTIAAIYKKKRSDFVLQSRITHQRTNTYSGAGFFDVRLTWATDNIPPPTSPIVSREGVRLTSNDQVKSKSKLRFLPKSHTEVYHRVDLTI